MLVHTLYPVGATLKNLHTGDIATVKYHGIADVSDEGETLELFMDSGKIWKSYNVEVMDTPNTAEVAYSFMQAKQQAGFFAYTTNARETFQNLVNTFLPAIERIDLGPEGHHLQSDYVIDFNDGSLLVLKLAENWTEYGFYAQIQDKRA